MTTREEETPSLPHRSPSLSRISSKWKKQTDSFLARKKRAKEEESFKKIQQKAALFPTTKNNKKIRNYLDRISLPRRSRLPFPVPSRLCSLYARACVVSGRTVSVLKGERERKVNTHAKSVCVFILQINPLGSERIGGRKPLWIGGIEIYISDIYINMLKRAKKKGSKRWESVSSRARSSAVVPSISRLFSPISFFWP